jgi:hypothetical protein
MLWDLGSKSSHSEVDILVVSSVRDIENGNSQLEHEKVCFISFCLFMNSRLEYRTVFPVMSLCPRKRRAMDYVRYQEALHLRYSPGGKRLISASPVFGLSSLP